MSWRDTALIEERCQVNQDVRNPLATQFSIKTIADSYLTAASPGAPLTGVKLRDHPLLSRHNVSTWPPVWAWVGKTKSRNPHGEVGVLKQVECDASLGRCFLIVEYENDLYMGCLFVNDPTFCRQLSIILRQHIGTTIKKIGDIDLPRSGIAKD
jgi:hypothetical protein